MKLNREVCALILALAILAIGLREIVPGFFAPAGSVQLVDASIPKARRDVVPRSIRSHVRDVELARDPFTFSEGWQRLDALPLDPPPLPPAPRPLPLFYGAERASERHVEFAERRMIPKRKETP